LGSRHDGHFGELIVRTLGAITASHCLRQSNDLASAFESGSSDSAGDSVGQQRIRRNDDVSAGNKHRQKHKSPFVKERLEPGKIRRRKSRESGQR
jgi:hypothetical protein